MTRYERKHLNRQRSGNLLSFIAIHLKVKAKVIYQGRFRYNDDWVL